MSWHIEPSDAVNALLLAHLGPAPEAPKREDLRRDHPWLVWQQRRVGILQESVERALEPRKAEISALEEAAQDRVELGEVPLEVLGHPCRWIQASCSLVLGSYLGRIITLGERSA